MLQLLGPRRFPYTVLDNPPKTPVFPKYPFYRMLYPILNLPAPHKHLFTFRFYEFDFFPLLNAMFRRKSVYISSSRCWDI